MPQATRTLPSVEYLHQCFDYDPVTGLLQWKQRPEKHFQNVRSFKTTTKRYAGQIAGSLSVYGYVLIHLDGKEVHASRIIYKMHHLVDPGIIDHKDRDRTNNKLANLRNVTNIQNARNRSETRETRCLPGVKTVGRKFQARIGTERRYIHLGTFNTAEQAHTAYRNASIRLFGEFSPFYVHESTEPPPVTQA